MHQPTKPKPARKASALKRHSRSKNEPKRRSTPPAVTEGVTLKSGPGVGALLEQPNGLLSPAGPAATQTMTKTLAAEHLPNILPHHLKRFRASGLSDETIRVAKLSSETSPHKVAAMLGCATRLGQSSRLLSSRSTTATDKMAIVGFALTPPEKSKVNPSNTSRLEMCRTASTCRSAWPDYSMIRKLSY